MSFANLTIDTTLIADAARYAAACARLDGEAAPGLTAVWASRFGPLNQVFLMQSAEKLEEACQLTTPPATDAVVLEDRERILLQQLAPAPAPGPEEGVLELRAYDIQIGRGDWFLAHMLPALQTRVRYSKNYGVWRTVSGRPDRIYHLWGYRTLEERDEVRERLRHEPVWQRYVDTILPKIRSMKSTLVTPLQVS